MIPDLADLGIRLEPATKHHARELARCIRRADRDEICAATGGPPEPILRASVNMSLWARAAYCGDDLLCIFGVSGRGDVRVPWAVTGVGVDRHRVAFWKAGKRVIEAMRDAYPILVNMVWAGYPRAVRWLRALGFTLGHPESFGVKQDKFYRAVLVTQHVIMAREEHPRV